jgi:hypothetical protein
MDGFVISKDVSVVAGHVLPKTCTNPVPCHGTVRPNSLSIYVVMTGQDFLTSSATNRPCPVLGTFYTEAWTFFCSRGDQGAAIYRRNRYTGPDGSWKEEKSPVSEDR